ncbi:MAG: hypothetical protein ACR2N3_02585 [Pyrinomonadaceae bacterium]
MKSANNIILAVAPATKRFGAVVFRNTEIIYFAVKPLKPPRTNESIKWEVSRSIENLLKEFSPKVIVLKSPSKQQLKSKQFKLIAQCAESKARFHQIPAVRINFEKVKKLLCPNIKPTKANAFKSLAAIYPELRQFTGNSSKWRMQYYDILLAAAALGYYHQTVLTETWSQT